MLGETALPLIKATHDAADDALRNESEDLKPESSYRASNTMKTDIPECTSDPDSQRRKHQSVYLSLF
jgi:hypothetical protein